MGIRLQKVGHQIPVSDKNLQPRSGDKITEVGHQIPVSDKNLQPRSGDKITEGRLSDTCVR